MAERQSDQLRRIQFLLVVLITLVATVVNGPFTGVVTTIFVVLVLLVDTAISSYNH